MNRISFDEFYKEGVPPWKTVSSDYDVHVLPNEKGHYWPDCPCSPVVQSAGVGRYKNVVVHNWSQ